MGLMVVIAILCAGIATFIGEDKNFNKVGSFVLGATLGPLGIVILLALKPRPPSRPGKPEWLPAQSPVSRQIPMGIRRA